MNKKKPAKLDVLLKLFLAAVLVLVVVKFAIGGNNAENATDGSVNNYLQQRKSLAKCLAEKGVKMYGSDTCPYCQNQKKMFGEDFTKINYINCDFDKSVCAEKGITGYPVWEIDDKMSAGLKSLEELAAATGCPPINAKFN